MFWKKKSEEVEANEKLTEEELIASDDRHLAQFDNSIKKVGNFMLYCTDDDINAEYTIQEAIQEGGKIYQCDNERQQRGYVYVAECNALIVPFYDYNKAKQFLEKYLELLSS